MKGSIIQSADFGRTIRRLMSVLVLAGGQRDQPRHGQGEQRGERAANHERRDVREPIRRDRRPAYGYDVPTYGEAPPPIVYAPPEPPAGINLMFNFR